MLYLVLVAGWNVTAGHIGGGDGIVCVPHVGLVVVLGANVLKVRKQPCTDCLVFPFNLILIFKS